MENTEICYILEEEKRKCIEKMKKYCNKYGDKHIQKLLDYLQFHIDNTTEEEIKKQLEEDMKLLNSYS